MLTWSASTKTHLVEMPLNLQSQANVEMAFYLYIETDNGQLVGVLSSTTIATLSPFYIASRDHDYRFGNGCPNASQEEVAGIVQRYDIIALPVVDEQRQLLGIITVDDVMDVIWELHENQMMRMAGMNEEHNPHEETCSRFFNND